MVTETAIPALKQKYRDEAVAAMQREFNYANPMQVPTVTKVSVNIHPPAHAPRFVFSVERMMPLTDCNADVLWA